MQISAQNVFATQHQAAHAQKPASQPAPFEPPEFKQADKPAEGQGTHTPAPTGYVRPGSQVDIKI